MQGPETLSLCLDTSLNSSLETIDLFNPDTGRKVSYRGKRTDASLLSLSVRLVEPVPDTSSIIPDWSSKTYRLSSYPPLAFFLGSYTFILLGALLIAACAQIQFLFPCLAGHTAVNVNNLSYCVPDSRLAEVTSTACPLDICSQRIPVTMQTFAVLLNGALAGSRTGTSSTILYVILVCLGAPFGAGGKFDPIWEKGAIIAPTGGYLFGFIFSTLIMGRCAERGHDRPRRVLWLILYMFLAEGAMYACGLFWLPFGLAIKAGVSPSKICPSDAGTCLRNIFNWGFVPFIPGDCFKMFLVLISVPACWFLLLYFHKRAGGFELPKTDHNIADTGRDNRNVPYETPVSSSSIINQEMKSTLAMSTIDTDISDMSGATSERKSTKKMVRFSEDDIEYN